MGLAHRRKDWGQEGETFPRSYQGCHQVEALAASSQREASGAEPQARGLERLMDLERSKPGLLVSPEACSGCH